MKKQKVILALALILLSGSALSAGAAETVEAPIKLGDYIQMGTYDIAIYLDDNGDGVNDRLIEGDGVDDALLWRCVAFEKIVGTDENGIPITDSSDTVTEYQEGYLPLMLADSTVCIKAFDVPGDNTSGSHSRDTDVRKVLGSSYWGDSNIRDWLNSSAGAGKVVWSCGNKPAQEYSGRFYDYSEEAGFLTNFSTRERAAMQTVVQKTSLALADIGLAETGTEVYAPDGAISSIVNNYSAGYAQWFTDTMFLLDAQQIYTVYANDEYLGGEGYYNLGHVHGDWLRTPFYFPGFEGSEYVHYLLLVSAYQDMDGLYPASPHSTGSCGVRPAFYLNPETGLTGSGTKEMPYEACSHQLTHHEAVSPTCTTEGNGEYWECTQCGKLFADGKAGEGLKAVPVLPAGHRWGKWTLQPDGQTLKRVCAADADHAETETLTVIVDGTSLVYDGVPQTPAVTLTAGEEPLTRNDDYTVEYADNVNAGTAKLTVTGQGNYDMTLTREFTIGKARVDPGTLRPGSLNIANNLAEEYTFALANLLPQLNVAGVTENRKDWGKPIYTVQSVSFEQAGYYDRASGPARIVREDGAAVLYLPILNNPTTDLSRGIVTVEISSDNYEPFTNTVTVNATNKTPVRFEGIRIAGKVYDGRPIACTGTPVIKVGETDVTDQIPAEHIEITYVGVDGTAYGGDRAKKPPTNAGSFKMVIRISDEDESYIGRQRFPFQITRADGQGQVTMAGYVHGGASGLPEAVSATNGTGSVSFAYKPKDADDSAYTGVKPTAAGEYTLRATFPETMNYKTVTATCEFTVGHVWATGWSKNDTCHWHECTAEGCNVTENSQKDGYAAHTPGEWTVDQAATDSAPESRHRVCSVCGYRETEIIPATGGTVITGGSVGGSTADYFTLTATAGPGGSISPSGRSTVQKRRSRTFTITPEEGYEVADVLVDDRSVGVMTEYTFEKVTENHTIKASFQKVEEPLSWNGFVDVTAEDWFYDSVKCVWEQGLMMGTDETHFSPGRETSRGMAATVIWRMAGEPEAKGTVSYPDCDPEAYYIRAVAWASEQGVVEGHDDGSFGPKDPVTREQLAAMLWRYARLTGQDVFVGEDTNILNYLDFDRISEWAEPALQWAVGSRVMQGRENGVLDPKGPATRAEVAAMLMRFRETA